MGGYGHSRLRGRDAMAGYAQQRQTEHDPAVLAEWREASA